LQKFKARNLTLLENSINILLHQDVVFWPWSLDKYRNKYRNLRNPETTGRSDDFAPLTMAYYSLVCFVINNTDGTTEFSNNLIIMFLTCTFSSA